MQNRPDSTCFISYPFYLLVWIFADDCPLVLTGKEWQEPIIETTDGSICVFAVDILHKSNEGERRKIRYNKMAADMEVNLLILNCVRKSEGLPLSDFII